MSKKLILVCVLLFLLVTGGGIDSNLLSHPPDNKKLLQVFSPSPKLNLTKEENVLVDSRNHPSITLADDPSNPQVVIQTGRGGREVVPRYGRVFENSDLLDQRSQNRQRGLSICQEKWSWEECEALDKIITAESGWNINAVNKSSGACGLFQRYRCTLTYEQLNDFNYQMNDGIDYIVERYGTPIKAWEFHLANGWY